MHLVRSVASNGVVFETKVASYTEFAYHIPGSKSTSRPLEAISFLFVRMAPKMESIHLRIELYA